MTLPTDAALLAALDTQYRRLSELLSRLEAARDMMIPPPANFWIGSARLAFDSAMNSMRQTVDAGIAALQAAIEYTAIASSEVMNRG